MWLSTHTLSSSSSSSSSRCRRRARPPRCASRARTAAGPATTSDIRRACTTIYCGAGPTPLWLHIGHTPNQGLLLSIYICVCMYIGLLPLHYMRRPPRPPWASLDALRARLRRHTTTTTWTSTTSTSTSTTMSTWADDDDGLPPLKDVAPPPACAVTTSTVPAPKPSTSTAPAGKSGYVPPHLRGRQGGATSGGERGFGASRDATRVCMDFVCVCSSRVLAMEGARARSARRGERACWRGDGGGDRGV